MREVLQKLTFHTYWDSPDFGVNSVFDGIGTNFDDFRLETGLEFDDLRWLFEGVLG